MCAIRDADAHRQRLAAIAAQIEEFEASGSRSRTGTGSRREGAEFEHLVRTFWQTLGKCAATAGAEPGEVVECRWPRKRRYW